MLVLITNTLSVRLNVRLLTFVLYKRPFFFFFNILWLLLALFEVPFNQQNVYTTYRTCFLGRCHCAYAVGNSKLMVYRRKGL